MLLAVISDTHMSGGSRVLPEACLERLRAADVILHAGDLVTAVVLADLRALGRPVEAVHGNSDDHEVRQLLPSARMVAAGGARIAMVHDAGAADGRLARMRRRFPEPTRSSSATRTSRCSSATPRRAFRSSIPAARPTAGASPRTRWGWRGSARMAR